MAGDDAATSGPVKFDPVKYTIIAAFSAVAWYNVIEINVQIFLTFKRHRGLYFWSLLICSWGIAMHVLAFVIKFFVPKANWIMYCILITLGWYPMVTGQSVVLYSRLHLVVRDTRILRFVLGMIIVDFFLFHIPTTVLTFGTNSPNAAQWAPRFNIMERLQMTAFMLQEVIISAIYVYATLRLLRPVYHVRTRKVMIHLVWINFIIIAMDVVLLVMEYTNKYEIQASLKPMVYSIKLKLEFAVLNQLMVLANTGLAAEFSNHSVEHKQPHGSGTHTGRSACSFSQREDDDDDKASKGLELMDRRKKAHFPDGPSGILKTQDVEVVLEKNPAPNSATTSRAAPEDPSRADIKPPIGTRGSIKGEGRSWPRRDPAEGSLQLDSYGIHALNAYGSSEVPVSRRKRGSLMGTTLVGPNLIHNISERSERNRNKSNPALEAQTHEGNEQHSPSRMQTSTTEQPDQNSDSSPTEPGSDPSGATIAPAQLNTVEEEPWGKNISAMNPRTDNSSREMQNPPSGTSGSIFDGPRTWQAGPPIVEAGEEPRLPIMGSLGAVLPRPGGQDRFEDGYDGPSSSARRGDSSEALRGDDSGSATF